MAPQLSTSEASQRIAEIARATGAERLDVMHLIKVAGIRPATDFRFENWSGISFAGLDLAGFDFTGANLLGCDFGRSRIAQARFDAAEIGYTQASTGGLRDIAGNGPDQVTNLREALDWDLFTKSWRASRPLFSDDHLRVGAIFQDAPFAPELAIVPAPRESNVSPNEMESRLGLQPWMAVSRFAVTFDEWQVFAHETNATMPFDEGWGQHRFPVVNITWDDAQAYVTWLGRRTGRPYRLLTDAEWESCCRASGHGQFNIGYAITQDDANFSPDARRRRTQTMRVGTFRPNSWGLFDMHGNVWEMCEDEFRTEWDSDSPDLLAPVDPDSRVARGGSFSNSAEFLAVSFRRKVFRTNRHNWLGFRVARSLLQRRRPEISAA